jgi:hypothetical protein
MIQTNVFHVMLEMAFICPYILAVIPIQINFQMVLVDVTPVGILSLTVILVR